MYNIQVTFLQRNTKNKKKKQLLNKRDGSPFLSMYWNKLRNFKLLKNHFQSTWACQKETGKKVFYLNFIFLTFY